MNPRMRRLMADAAAIRTEFVGHPNVKIIPIGSEPADSYRIEFRLRGATLDESGQPVIAKEHQVVVRLPASYPREKPIAVTESMVFHPNVGGHAGDEICIGDFWTPTRTLADIIVAIGEMIQYQRYNVKSPLNAVAAHWAFENEAIFPLGNVGLFQSEPDISLEESSATDSAKNISVRLGEGDDPDELRSRGGEGPLTSAANDS